MSKTDSIKGSTLISQALCSMDSRRFTLHTIEVAVVQFAQVKLV